MLLENRFYRLMASGQDGMSGTYKVAILEDCDVYEGHFPGDPVCPGVCNIETIKECAIRLLGRDVRIRTIKQCRLTAVATPTVCPEVTITVCATPVADNAFNVVASVKDDNRIYMEFKGTLE